MVLMILPNQFHDKTCPVHLDTLTKYKCLFYLYLYFKSHQSFYPNQGSLGTACCVVELEYHCGLADNKKCKVKKKKYCTNKKN